MSAAKKTGNVMVWVIMALLIFGLGGFGVTNFGGSVQSIGKVGDTEIPLNEYARELSQELRAAQAQFGQNLTLQEATLFGVPDRARANVINAATLDNELTRMNLSVGDAEVRRTLLNYDAFKGLDGKFDREAYRFTLDQNGLSEKQFEEQIRAEATRTILQAAVLSGISAPEAYTGALYDFIASRRSFDMIELTANDLPEPVGDPSDADLQAYYEANPAAFTTPETKQITYAWLSPEMLIDTVDVDIDALRALYEDRADEYKQPERRLVERLIFATADEAQAAKDAIDAGESDFDALVADRGLTLADVDMGDVAASDLGSAGDVVFGAADLGVVGPADTDLGPALFRINAVLAAQETTFEEAQDELRAELAQDNARRAIGDLMTDIDDRLAAGATLEELASETEMELGQIGWFMGNDDGIGGYAAFRDAALAVQDGDFPEIIELDDGGIFALRLNEITAPALQALDDVRDAATEGWLAQETAARLAAYGEELKARLDAGDLMDDLGHVVSTSTALTRGEVTPLALADAVFASDAGDSAVVSDGRAVLLVQVTELLGPDANNPAAAQLEQSLQAQAAQGVGRDLFVYFSQALLQDAGLTLNQQAINAVHAQYP